MSATFIQVHIFSLIGDCQDYRVYHHILRGSGAERYQEPDLLLYSNIVVWDYRNTTWVSYPYVTSGSRTIILLN